MPRTGIWFFCQPSCPSSSAHFQALFCHFPSLPYAACGGFQAIPGHARKHKNRHQCTFFLHSCFGVPLTDSSPHTQPGIFCTVCLAQHLQPWKCIMNLNTLAPTLSPAKPLASSPENSTSDWQNTSAPSPKTPILNPRSQLQVVKKKMIPEWVRASYKSQWGGPVPAATPQSNGAGRTPGECRPLLSRLGFRV